MDKLGKYLEKQDKAEKPVGYWNSVARLYRDYIEECQTLELDLNDKQVLFPKNLKQAHERTMAQIKFEKNKADQEKFQKAVEKMERYTWEWKGLLIRPARTQEELQADVYKRQAQSTRNAFLFRCFLSADSLIIFPGNIKTWCCQQCLYGVP